MPDQPIAPATQPGAVPAPPPLKALPRLSWPVVATAAVAGVAAAASDALPQALTQAGSRGGAAGVASLVPNVSVVQRWVLAPAPASRGDAAAPRAEVAADTRLLALEAVDGSTVFMRADALSAQLARARPELIGADGSIDFAGLRDRDANSRGIGDWVWKQVTQLLLAPDGITALAQQKASEWLGEKVEDLGVAGASWAGAKALMWAIESQLAGPPGLYAWNGGPLTTADRCSGDADPRLAPLTGASAQQALVFIHGTGSHTLGGFGELAGTAAWPALQQQFEGRIFGFEHRTFSESPIDNALALADALPAGARLCLVTHSRGGLVGDLMCLATDGADASRDFAVLVDAYRRQPRPDEVDAEAADPRLQTRRLAAAAEEQAKLRALAERLRTKRLQVERYVRVAAPARGTALLSDNLDLFLSGLLGLVRKFGAWSVGAVTGAVATPIAGHLAQAAADQALALLGRVVLEIADKRLQPQVVPGIEAMLPEAPLGMLLGRAALRSEVRLAVVAGDIEGGGLAKRIGVMFTDWMLFDRADNDLVVDTASMYGGLAGRGNARALFLQGANINHLRYFRDDTRSDGLPLPQALQSWLKADDPLQLAAWQPLVDPALALPAPAAGIASRGAAAPQPPSAVLVYVPGIMGSHLAADGDRVWLDPFDLARGRLARIAIDAPGPIDADGLIEHAYGGLADYLGASHQVQRFAYDWRLPIRVLGEALAQALEKALEQAKNSSNGSLPLRILAHSMGGLLVRAAFAARPGLWDAVVASGGRLVMLGTPQHGSHKFVETLLGQSSTIRTLACADLRHNMQQVLDIVAGFPGALHLLPAPGFVDAGGPAGRDYFDRAAWDALAAVNNDFWFGRQLGGRPLQTALDEARAFWQSVADTAWVRAHPERIACVWGQADNTACGLVPQASGVTLLGTPEGDGSVTWASARLPGLPDARCWLMPVDHMGLTSTASYFDEIESLLHSGEPQRLGRPVAGASRAGNGETVLRRYKAGPPPPFPSDAELLGQLLGGTQRLATVARRRRPPLAVKVRAMDVRFAHVPVLCGHYRGDPIAGAEALIDAHLVDGALSRRAQLGIHAGDVGSAAVVLMPRSDDDIVHRLGRGAVVVGLGEMGRLSADGVAESVRAGVLRFLMFVSDRHAEERQRAIDNNRPLPPPELRLASLLIGTNSAAQLSMADSIKAMVLGVLRANREFAEGAADCGAGVKPLAAPVQVSELEFVEVYRDAAISAADAVAGLRASLGTELRRLGAEIEADEELRYGDGVRERLSVATTPDYWPRIMVCDADCEDSACGPECFDIRVRHNIPPDTLRRVLTLYGGASAAANASSNGNPAAQPLLTGLDLAPTVRHAERLKFVYLGEKARAETIIRQRQPGLVEKLVDEAFHGTHNTVYDPGNGFGNTLFQLLVPLEFKAAARKSDNLILVVDAATANLPWEMLEADGEPLVLKTRLVRQLTSMRFRREISTSQRLTACVIGNPGTAGFHAQFGWAPGRPFLGADGAAEPDRLPPLPGAQREGEAVAQRLESAGYDVARTAPDAPAATVFTQLFARAHRVLVVAAHGLHSQRAADGSLRTGVVLSNGLLLSAAEIELMESVPDLVFLSCCHLGTMDSAGASPRLAYSLARELIEIGVRCVVAAGWEVADDAAQTFSETFFQRMAAEGSNFADALFDARRTTFERHPGCNTWGAYQAYGDPLFRLKTGVRPENDTRPMRAPEELLRWLDHKRLGAQRAGGGDSSAAGLRLVTTAVERRLASVPRTWADRPDVQHAIGMLYAAFGEAGFEPARTALLRAIAQECKSGMVPLAAVEQLANFEARSAEQLGASDDPQRQAQALERIDMALARLTHLIQLSSANPAASASTACGNPERQGLLGSAYKRRAALLVRDPAATWETVRPWVHKARNAYLGGEADGADSADVQNYGRLNRLQLDALLGERIGSRAALVEAVQGSAARRFAATFDFWDAVAAGDALLTRWLFDTSATTGNALQQLTRAYAPAMKVPTAARHVNSVVKQHRLLAGMLRKRAAPGDGERADVLDQLADALSGTPAPQAAVPTEPATAVVTARARTPAAAARAVEKTAAVEKPVVDKLLSQKAAAAADPRKPRRAPKRTPP